MLGKYGSVVSDKKIQPFLPPTREKIERKRKREEKTLLK
jgi:hypothetical protein